MGCSSSAEDGEVLVESSGKVLEDDESEAGWYFQANHVYFRIDYLPSTMKQIITRQIISSFTASTCSFVQ